MFLTILDRYGCGLERMDEEGTEMILERTQVPVVTLCYLCGRKDDPSVAVLKFAQRSVMVKFLRRSIRKFQDRCS